MSTQLPWTQTTVGVILVQGIMAPLVGAIFAAVITAIATAKPGTNVGATVVTAVLVGLAAAVVLFLVISLTSRRLRPLVWRWVPWLGTIRLTTTRRLRAVARPQGQQVRFHDSVASMETANSFWNDLPEQARKTFIRVGRSNKSWIGKSQDASLKLGNALTAILSGNGEVVIVSINSPRVIDATVEFFRKYVDPDVIARYAISHDTRRPARLEYRVVARTNFSAVVSDDRMLFIPLPNSSAFGSEAMILEFSREISPQPFENYLADIRRLIASGKPIDLTQAIGPPAP